MTKEQHPNDIAYSNGYKQGVFDTEMRYQTIDTPEATSRVGGNEEQAEQYAREFCRKTPRIKQESGVEFYERLNATIFNILTTKDQEKEEAIAKARDQEAKLWFETWYSHYISPTKPLQGEFAKFATERIQMTGYERDQALPTEDNK